MKAVRMLSNWKVMMAIIITVYGNLLIAGYLLTRHYVVAGRRPESPPVAKLAMARVPAPPARVPAPPARLPAPPARLPAPPARVPAPPAPMPAPPIPKAAVPARPAPEIRMPAGTIVEFNKFEQQMTFRLELGQFLRPDSGPDYRFLNNELFEMAGLQPPADVPASRGINEGQYVVGLIAAHPGMAPRPIDKVFLVIIRSGVKQAYLRNHNIRIACGNMRIAVEQSYYMPQYRDDVIIWDQWRESLMAEVSVRELETALGQGRNLEVKIGIHDPFPIGPQAGAKILAFIRAVRSGAV
jgi:hypothetical protein